MPSAYSASARFVLQATGENNNPWGVILNQGAFQLIDDNINGRLAFNLSGVKTLTTALGATDEARMAMLAVTGGAGGQIVIPAVSKGYFVRNNSAGDVLVTAPGTGVVGATFKVLDAGPVFSDGVSVFPIMLSGLPLRDYIASQVTGGGSLPSPAGSLGKALVVQDQGSGPFWNAALIDAPQLAPNAVTAPALANGAVTNPKLGLGAVFTSNIANGQITAPLLAPGVAVANLGYTPANKAGDTFTGPTAFNASIGVTGDITLGGALFLGGAGRAYLSSDGVNYAQIVWDRTGPVYHRYNWATGVLTFSSPAQPNAMTLDQNGNVAFAGSLTALGITPADNTVTTAKLAASAVTTPKIADANVTAAKLAAGAAVANVGYTPANKAGEAFGGPVSAPQLSNFGRGVIVSSDNANFSDVIFDNTLNFRLRYNWSTGKLTWFANGVAVFSIDAGGTVRATNFLLAAP